MTQKSLDIILVMTDAPLPFGKAPSRWFYVLYKGLLERGHKVRALAIYDNEEDRTACEREFPDLKLFATRKKSNLIQKVSSLFQPFSHHYGPELKAYLNEELSKGYDILHLEQLWTSWLTPVLNNKTVVNIHYSYEIDYKANEGESLKDAFHRWQGLRLEKTFLKRLINASVLSDRLGNIVRKHNPKSHIYVRPLGIDDSKYIYLHEAERKDTKTVVLIGSMWWTPSLSAAKRVLENLWPEILKNVPDAKLKIVGRNAVQALGSYLPMDSVEIIENVPDIEPFFKEGSLFFYPPEFGSGMKVKILEAMLYGIPVVTNTDGVEGLLAEDSVHALIGETDEELVSKVTRLLNDTELQESLRKEARALIEKTCGPGPTLDLQEEIYHSILK